MLIDQAHFHWSNIFVTNGSTGDIQVVAPCHSPYMHLDNCAITLILPPSEATVDVTVIIRIER